MKFGCLLLQVGEIPPAAGQARTDFLITRGHTAARFARTASGLASAAVESVLGPTSFPFALDPTAKPNSFDSHVRLDAWERLRHRLIARSAQDPLPGEENAREALRHSANAFRDLAQTKFEATAHRRLHQCAEFVGGLYGCWMRWDPKDRLWYDSCTLVHAHNPYGLSVGFTSTRLCSVCRQDISECDHIGSQSYQVIAERYEEVGVSKCSVCHEGLCDHVVGTSHVVTQTQVMRDAVMHEVTITPSPREPRARFTEMEMKPQPQPPGTSHDRLRCLRCLAGCDGLPEPEPL